MGDKLRAVVITDYERMSARTRRLKGILDPDAGSAVRVFRLLVADPVTELAGPRSGHRQGGAGRAPGAGHCWRAASATGWQKHRANFAWEWRDTGSDQVLAAGGQRAAIGPRAPTWPWSPTSLSRGVTRCLVGTRGIFGEGWDALRPEHPDRPDLGDDQHRRAADPGPRPSAWTPAWPRKVAHNWDVVCVSRDFDKGDADLRRFAARHAHTWGIDRPGPAGIRATAQEWTRREAPPGPPLRCGPDRARRGPRGSWAWRVDLGARSFSRWTMRPYTRRMLDAVWDRDPVYDLWGVGHLRESRSIAPPRSRPGT